MSRKRRESPIPRVLLSLLGAAFILWAVVSLMLGIFGERATATLDSIRRVGGERPEVRPGRYTYSLGYTFTSLEGKEIHGFSTKIGGATFIKANGTGRIAVRYFPAAPFLNAPETDACLSLRHPVLIGTGLLLIVLMNRKKT